MDSKYNKLKKGLGSENTPVPPELDWENMQEGIFQKMEKLENSGNQRKSYLIRALIVIVILLLIQFVCSPFSFERNEEATKGSALMTDKQERKNSNESDVEEYKKELKPNENNAYEDKNVNNNTVYTKNQLTGKQSNARVAASTISNRDIESDSNDPRNLSLQINSENQSKAFGSLASSSNLYNSNTEETSTLNKEQNEIIETFQSRNNNAIHIKAVPQLSLIEGISAGLEYEILYARNMPSGFSHITENTNQEVQKTLIMAGGATYWLEGFGSAKPQRQAYESPVMSYGTSLAYMHRFANKIELFIGLQYSKLESRFDYEQKLENYTVTIKDTLVEVQNNLITGRESFVRGDVEVPVDAKRVVRHYNSIEIIQFPFALGRSFSMNKLEIGIYGGGSLNIQTSAQGKSLFNDSITEYASQDELLISKDLKFSGMLYGRLAYSLSERVSLSLNLQLQRSLTDWSLEDEITMRPVIFSSMLGFEFRL